jgi:hypothetical protein
MAKEFSTEIVDIIAKMKAATAEGTEAHGDEFHSVHRVQLDRLERILGKGVGMAPLRDNDDQMREFLKGVVGVVEASSQEYHNIWDRNDRREEGKKRIWVSDLTGLGACVGTLAGYPVYVSMRKATIDGHLILFVEGTSRVVDHTMIRDWMTAAMNKWSGKTKRDVGPGQDEEWRWTDATNFHNVFPR